MVRKTEFEYEYECIDGNWTKHPVAFCLRYEGVLTKGLMKTHGCKCKKNGERCSKLKYMDFE